MSTPHNVCIVLGTRPEAIKLAPVIQAFQAAPDFRTRVVLTGQHREMVAQVMELFGIQADHDLALMAPKQTLTHITCGALQGLQAEFEQHKPDLVLVQGDTTTALPRPWRPFMPRCRWAMWRRACAPTTSWIPIRRRRTGA